MLATIYQIQITSGTNIIQVWPESARFGSDQRDYQMWAILTGPILTGGQGASRAWQRLDLTARLPEPALQRRAAPLAPMIV